MRANGLSAMILTISLMVVSPAEAQFWKGFAEGFNRSFHGGKGGEARLGMSMLEPGFYKVRAKRKGGDIYEINSTSYLKTRGCYEYTSGDDAILEVTSTSGYEIGVITFMSSGNTCRVQAYME